MVHARPLLLFFLLAVVGPARALLDYSESQEINVASQGCHHTGPVDSKGDGLVVFGVRPTYQKDLACSWTLPAANQAVASVVITQLDMEMYRDVLVLRGSPMGSSAQEEVKLSGEYDLPRIVTFRGDAPVSIEFASRRDLLEMNRTAPLSFAMTHLSSGGEAATCYKDCNAHGSCNQGVCACSAGWIGDACSTVAPVLAANTPVGVEGLGLGSYQYYTFTLEQASNVLLEFVDAGHVHSSAMLMLGAQSPPTFNPDTFVAHDVNTWFFDNSDIHYVRGALPAGTYIAAVGNHPNPNGQQQGGQDIAQPPVQGKLAVRVGAHPTDIPCIHDCFGHGRCDTAAGECRCTQTQSQDASLEWAGRVLATGLETCEHPVEALATDKLLEGEARVGDWVYYKVNVAHNQANQRTLLIHFKSLSEEAHPILLLRKGDVPVLRAGYMPTYDAFAADYGDEEGFSVHSGVQQSITVEPEGLGEGDWYIGVYNLWGKNGVGHSSQDHLKFQLYANVYSLGTPCPMANMLPCNGHTCDFNTGTCSCPPTLIGEGCGLAATPITPTARDVDSVQRDESAVGAVVPAVRGVVGVGGEALFVVEITEEHLAGGPVNLKFDLYKPEDQRSLPYLIVKENGVPDLADHDAHDEHDLQAFYYGMPQHQIVLDAHQLTQPTLYYFKVVNTAYSQEPLTYAVSASFHSLMQCPTTVPGEDCSGHGDCDYQTGRCWCKEGFTMDACEAVGVTHVASDGRVAHTPAIGVNQWAFWSVTVGCPGQSLSVVLDAQDAGAAPMLMIRRDVLPLQMEEAADYFDAYRGITHDPRHQSVVVSGCEGEGCSGLVRPVGVGSHQVEAGDREAREEEDAVLALLGVQSVTELVGGGTVWEKGALEPGVYYIGVYNDYAAATEPLSHYSLTVRVQGSCDGHCTRGFGGEDCGEVCPGVLPLNHYSAAPMPRGEACSGHGSCGGEGGLSCTCLDGFLGDACEYACPRDALTNAVCGGQRGTCSLFTHSEEGHDWVFEFAGCACKDGFVGPACESRCEDDCNGNGECVFDWEANQSTCQCTDGFYGPACGVAQAVSGKNDDSSEQRTETAGVTVAPGLPGYAGPLIAVLVLANMACLGTMCYRRRRHAGYHSAHMKGGMFSSEGDAMVDKFDSGHQAGGKGGKGGKPRACSTDVDEESGSPQLLPSQGYESSLSDECEV